MGCAAHTKGVPLDLQLEALEFGRLGCGLAGVSLGFFVDCREGLEGCDIPIADDRRLSHQFDSDGVIVYLFLE